MLDYVVFYCFLYTSKPDLEYLSLWIREGLFSDPHGKSKCPI